MLSALPSLGSILPKNIVFVVIRFVLECICFLQLYFHLIIHLMVLVTHQVFCLEMQVTKCLISRAKCPKYLENPCKSRRTFTQNENSLSTEERSFLRSPFIRWRINLCRCLGDLRKTKESLIF